MTFTLAGFNTLKRDGITISGSAISNISVELRVGSLEETVVVTGEAPVVDVQSTRRDVTFDNDTIRNIPSARSYRALVDMVPGVQTDRNNVNTGPLIAISPSTAAAPSSRGSMSTASTSATLPAATSPRTTWRTSATPRKSRSRPRVASASPRLRV